MCDPEDVHNCLKNTEPVSIIVGLSVPITLPCTPFVEVPKPYSELPISAKPEVGVETT